MAIDARAPGLLACTRQDDGADIVVASQEPPQLLQLLAHLCVECVEYFGPIERDDRDAVALLVEQSFVTGHSRFSWIVQMGQRLYLTRRPASS